MPVLKQKKCRKCKAMYWQGDLILGPPVLDNPTGAQKVCVYDWKDASFFDGFIHLAKAFRRKN